MEPTLELTQKQTGRIIDRINDLIYPELGITSRQQQLDDMAALMRVVIEVAVEIAMQHVHEKDPSNRNAGGYSNAEHLMTGPATRVSS